MMGRVEMWARALRRRLSRSEWAIRLLRLSTAPEQAATAPSLLLIQIDGLSGTQLKHALARGQMPFLQRLLAREHYALHAQYSGIPASTPAVQAELFYGIKSAVPAFSFVDQASGQLFTMYEPKAAAEIERRLAQRGGEPLLSDGSAYSDIFTGGAAEAHFCSSTMGWGTLAQEGHWPVLPLLALLHLDIWIRTIALMVVEVILACIACVRGILIGKPLPLELQFIFTRVAICILLRELIVAGAKIDLARGLPVIHVNFIGYDEQAHRRGPSSTFAAWSLRGIDHSIARLWHAAQRSTRRHYDVWIYSDHGQEDTEPYQALYGRRVEDAVAEVFGEPLAARVGTAREEHGVQLRRVNLLGSRLLSWLLSIDATQDAARNTRHAVVTAMGSLGHLYPPQPLTEEQRAQYARALVTAAHVPLVLTAAAARSAHAWTAAGMVTLPNEAALLFGEQHPYLQEIAHDLVEVCHHPDAGTFVLCGWRRDAPPVSFPVENGSHTGPGREETNAFALLPVDVPLPERERGSLRARDLRQAALRHLGRASAHVSPAPRPAMPRVETLRIMTYNVHSCIGMDGKCSPERIARVIARHRPDIVALQELDVCCGRSGGIDQAQQIAQRLQMMVHFSPALQVAEGQYGNAVLSHYPMELIQGALLPQWRLEPRYEPRAALWMALDVAGTRLQLITSHLSLWSGERLRQAEALLSPAWLGDPRCQEPVILCGDFNAGPGSLVCRRFMTRLRDAQRVLESHRPRNTWSSRYPFHRIDHIFLSPSLDVMSLHVPSSELEKVSSDHLPLLVELRLPRAAAVLGSANPSSAQAYAV